MSAAGTAARLAGVALAVVVGIGPLRLAAVAATRVPLGGAVVDAASGAPIEGALIRAGALEAWSDPGGWYQLSVPAGVYELHAAAPGFVAATVLDQNVGSAGLRVDLLLPPLEPRPQDETALAANVRAWPSSAGSGDDRLHGPSVPDDPAGGADETEGPQAPPTGQVPAEIRVLMPDGSIVPMETDEYLKGVVPAEMGYVFQRASEALKAQAIASRTYASRGCLRETAGDPAVCEPGLDANVDTTTRTQVWRPVHYDVADEAVVATHGQALRLDGNLIPSLFFARTVEWTLASEASRCCGGRVWPFLKARSSPEAFAERWGHGAGMSQEGAAAFADWGATATEIVGHFYSPAVPGAASPAALEGEPVRSDAVSPAGPEGEPARSADAPTGGPGALGPIQKGPPIVGAVRAGRAAVSADDFAVPAGTPAKKGAKGIVADPSRTAVIEGPVVQTEFAFNTVGASIRAALPAGTSLLMDIRASRDGADWSAWVALNPDDDDAKEPGPVGTRWTGLAVLRGRWLQTRITLVPVGDKSPTFEGVTLHYLNSDAGPSAPVRAKGVQELISRSGWGADETLRFDAAGSEIWPADYTTPRAEIVHHTVTSNAPADPAAIVRSIYHYHAITRGWGDIGYNFLVDARGNVYEGRFGGEKEGKISQGGHALQFNTNTIGVALLGTFTAAADRPSGEAIVALEELLAVKATRYGIQPSRGVVLADVAFPYGILGHRDVLPGHTACPGDGMEALLPEVRGAVEGAMGAPPTPPTAAPPPPDPTSAATATAVPATPTEAPAGTRCADVVVAGGFETDDPGWTRSRSHLTRYDAYAGAQSLFVGLTSQDADDQPSWSSASQFVSVPADGSRATLRFAAKTYGDADDRRLVRIMDAKGRVLALGELDLPPGEPWREYSFDVSRALEEAGAGGFRLYFGVVNNGDGDRSHLRLDQVALEVCAVPAAEVSPTVAAPTATRPPTSEPEIVCGDLLGGDGSFEQELSGWHASGNHPAVAAQADSPDGGAALRLAPDADGLFGYAAAERGLAAPGRLLTSTLSLWVRRDAAASPAMLELRHAGRGKRRPLLRWESGEGAASWEQAIIGLDPAEAEHGTLYAAAMSKEGSAAGTWFDGVTVRGCWVRSWPAYLPAAHRR